MKRRHQHRHEHPSGERLREIVAASGLEPGQEEAGLAFARELAAVQRTSFFVHRSATRKAGTVPLSSCVRLAAVQSPFSQRTKRVVMKYFRRGLHGRALWRIGQAVLEWRFGKRR